MEKEENEKREKIEKMKQQEKEEKEIREKIEEIQEIQRKIEEMKKPKENEAEMEIQLKEKKDHQKINEEKLKQILARIEKLTEIHEHQQRKIKRNLNRSKRNQKRLEKSLEKKRKISTVEGQDLSPKKSETGKKKEKIEGTTKKVRSIQDIENQQKLIEENEKKIQGEMNRTEKRIGRYKQKLEKAKNKMQLNDNDIAEMIKNLEQQIKHRAGQIENQIKIKKNLILQTEKSMVNLENLKMEISGNQKTILPNQGLGNAAEKEKEKEITISLEENEKEKEKEEEEIFNLLKKIEEQKKQREISISQFEEEKNERELKLKEKERKIQEENEKFEEKKKEIHEENEKQKKIEELKKLQEEKEEKIKFLEKEKKEKEEKTQKEMENKIEEMEKEAKKEEEKEKEAQENARGHSEAGKMQDEEEERKKREQEEENMKKMRARRTNIARELVETEKSYVTSLNTLVWKFQKPLLEKNQQKKGQQSILTGEEIKLLFSNVEIILNFNKILLETLDQRIKVWNPETSLLGDFFMKVTDFLRIYVDYVNNFDLAINFITSQKQSNKALKQFLTKTERLPACRGLTIESFLIMPVQRVPRYVMLLMDLLKNTWDSHPDFNNLQVSLQKMKATGDFINESKRSAENKSKLYEVYNSFIKPPDRFIQPFRLFIRQGDVKWYKNYIASLFLFSDVLIISKPIRHNFDVKSQIVLQNLSVTSVCIPFLPSTIPFLFLPSTIPFLFLPSSISLFPYSLLPLPYSLPFPLPYSLLHWFPYTTSDQSLLPLSHSSSILSPLCGTNPSSRDSLFQLSFFYKTLAA